MARPLDIAIIGLAGVYPGAKDARAFWQNICAKVDAISEAPADWVGPYFEPGTNADDRIYTTRGGFLHELAHVDPLEVGLMPSVAAGADPDHLLALKLARDALADAGYAQGKGIDGSRAGVVIARGTYGNRGLASMLARGFFMDQMMDVIRQLRPDFTEAEIRALQTDLKKQLPPYGGDFVGVLTPNVIAGLIANRLDFMGPSYIVDAACASALIALDQAVQELTSGRCDLMLCGGTQAQTPPQLFIQFCQIQALSRDRLRPFQKGADGTLLGEGSGMLVLKRLADAEAAGDRIYAVIKGIGTASDGKAKGLLAPRLEGEVLALRRAYESSGIDPLTVDLIEAHGTGTVVGDKTEIEALTEVFGARGRGPKIAISAVKSMIGHCLPATGTASLIKTALALHHKVLPPMLCDEPDPALNLERTPLYINNQTRPWVHGGETPRRAGVNAFGFGGINAHVVLEEYVPALAKTQVGVLNTPESGEVFLLAADSRDRLVELAQAALAQLDAALPLTPAEVARAASAHTRGAHRLAIVCDGAADLRKKLGSALDKLASADAAPFKTRNGVYYGHGQAPGKLCLLFPGEGSQYPDMLRELALRFPQVRAGFDFIEDAARRRGSRSRAALVYPAPTGYDAAQRAELEAALQTMDVGAESVFAASLALQRLYDDLALHFDAMLGHSTGENTALTASGVRRYASTDELAEAVQAVHGLYRRLDAEGRIVHGTLLSVGGLDEAMRAELLAGDHGLQLAMDNCPNQLVLFGTPEAAERLREQLSAQGAICQALAFGRAYHTPLFKPMADAFRDYFRALDFGPGRVPLYSARSCAPFPDDAAAIRELAAQQWENPVRFTETLRRLYDDGYRVFLEVGPGGTLTSFVADTLRDKSDVIAIASDNRRRGSLTQFHTALATLFAAGIVFDPRKLYAHRDVAEFDLLAPPRVPKTGAPKQALRMPQVVLPAQWKRPLPATSPLPQAGTANEDARLALLRSHFALMQDFLDSQARVLGLVAGVATTVTPTAPAPGLDPAYPLLGTVREQSDAHLVMERRFDLDTDAFLRDHCIGGAPSARDPSLLAIPVMPFTFSLEICAEAAAKLVGCADLKVVALEHARGSRWLSLDDGALHLRIAAERIPTQNDEAARVHVRLFLLGDAAPSGGVIVFEAQVLLAADYLPAPPPLDWPGADAKPPRFNADDALYTRGMFHGPRLQGAKKLLRWNAQAIDMELTTLPTQDWFGFTQAPRLQLDAALADVLGQTFYYWLQEQHGGLVNCFPYAIGRLTLHAPPLPAGTPLYSRARLQVPAPDRLSADVEARDAQNRVVMRATQWEDRTFEVPERFYRFRLQPARNFLGEVWMDGLLPPGLHARRVAPFDDDLLASGGGIWGRGLAHMVLNRAERARWYALPAAGPRREEWLLGRIAAKEAARDWLRTRHRLELASADIEIVGDDRGRPEIRIDALPHAAMPALSIAHSHGFAAAVVADPGLAVGLDYQRLRSIRANELIQGAFGDAEQHWFAKLDEGERGLVATALWCAKEAASKAAGTGLQGRPLDWVVSACQLDPRSVAFGSAQVVHAGRVYDVALQFEGRDAISALCLVAAPARQHVS
ncbi:beta-ketoacyl synthase N-terminal-like domain-containing protein [Sinimarinibacterium thermocellulolyticum]|uniref:Beta-ketoacyl synthase N-terminal-like domain-containing protein n=1 Tax=Sinimarinibacterium thermocellulolyticum TaxID=3170016 RepID=A0ABV2A6A6_9GAMM